MFCGKNILFYWQINRNYFVVVGIPKIHSGPMFYLGGSSPTQRTTIYQILAVVFFHKWFVIVPCYDNIIFRIFFQQFAGVRRINGGHPFLFYLKYTFVPNKKFPSFYLDVMPFSRIIIPIT